MLRNNAKFVFNMLHQRLTPAQAWEKIKYYCAYQERSHQETKDKLYQFGLNTAEVDEQLARLIEENFLNEERFAIAFVGGKFRMKKWGRIKIKSELKMKRVSPYNIAIAMKEINEEDYQAVMEKLIAEKWAEFKSDQYIVRQVKTIRYMLQKGYETELVRDYLQKIRSHA